MRNGLVISSFGTKSWFKNDNYHREEGPAIEYASGQKEYYLEGKRLTESQFENYRLKITIERMGL